jgi:hypothetical protein
VIVLNRTFMSDSRIDEQEFASGCGDFQVQV